MKYYPLFFLILFFSCKKKPTTNSGYTYQFHIDEEGIPAVVGDKVIFHEKILLNEEEVFSTYEIGEKVIVLPPDSILTRPLPPNYEILMLMSPGDSITVTQVLKNMTDLPEGFESEDVMKYSIKLISIVPAREVLELKKNRKNKSISGYPFQFLREKGNIKIQVGDFVSYHESIFKNDSLMFQTSTEMPREVMIPPANKIKKPTPANLEGLKLMGEGDSLHIFQTLEGIPQLPPFLTPEDTLKYHLLLVKVKTPGEFFLEKQIEQTLLEIEKEKLKNRMKEITSETKDLIEKFESGALENELETTESGLKYIIHEEGSGKLPTQKKMVHVHYAGFLMNGQWFDNSFDRGKPYKFPLGMGRVIQGWDEGVARLKVGTKATFFIPYTMAYGEAGNPPKIPEKANLVFYLEIVKAE